MYFLNKGVVRVNSLGWNKDSWNCWKIDLIKPKKSHKINIYYIYFNISVAHDIYPCLYFCLLRNGMFPAIPIHNNFTSSAILAFRMWIPEPWKYLGWRRIPVIWQAPGCSHSLWWALRNSGCEKHRILAPDMKGMISVSPDSCIFPYEEKCYIL